MISIALKKGSTRRLSDWRHEHKKQASDREPVSARVWQQDGGVPLAVLVFAAEARCPPPQHDTALAQLATLL
jgi:hypothetical protein